MYKYIKVALGCAVGAVGYIIYKYLKHSPPNEGFIRALSIEESFLAENQIKFGYYLTVNKFVLRFEDNENYEEILSRLRSAIYRVQKNHILLNAIISQQKGKFYFKFVNRKVEILELKEFNDSTLEREFSEKFKEGDLLWRIKIYKNGNEIILVIALDHCLLLIPNMVIIYKIGISDGASCMTIIREILEEYEKLTNEKIDTKNGNELLNESEIKKLKCERPYTASEFKNGNLSFLEKLQIYSKIYFSTNQLNILYSYFKNTLNRIECDKEIDYKNRKTGIICETLNSEITKKFIQKCKKENTTIFGGLASACTLAFYDLYKYDNLHLNVLFSVRPYMKPSINGNIIGYYVNNFTLNSKIDKNFWENARKLKKQLDSKFPNLGKFLKEREFILKNTKIGENDFNTKNGRINEITISNRGNHSSTINFSILGNYKNIKTHYGNLSLASCHQAASEHQIGNLFCINCVSFNNEMHITFVYYHPIVEREKVLNFAKHVLKYVYENIE